MRVKAMLLLLAGVLVLVPGVVENSSAAPIPGYFGGERAGVVLATVQAPTLGTVAAIIQINFDPTTNGGISSTLANSLFSQVASGIPSLVSALGLGSDLSGFQSFSPSQIQSFGFNALNLAQLLSAQFGAFGFSLYAILDVYVWTAESFLGSVPTLKVDLFIVLGNNNVMYAASVELVRSVVGF